MKDMFLRVQELPIATFKKWCKEGRRLAQLRKDLLVKLKWKKEMYRQWNQAHFLGKM